MQQEFSQDSDQLGLLNRVARFGRDYGRAVAQRWRGADANELHHHHHRAAQEIEEQEEEKEENNENNEAENLSSFVLIERSSSRDEVEWRDHEQSGIEEREEREDFNRLDAFAELLWQRDIDLQRLRQLCARDGVPQVYRCRVWKLLLGYVPAGRVDALRVVQRRRSHYWKLAKVHCGCARRDESEAGEQRTCSRAALGKLATLDQVRVDIPRTIPTGFVALFERDVVREALERILFVWALEHEAIGYYQGMNDLVVPFLIVFMADKFGVRPKQLNVLPDSVLCGADSTLEADVYWCADKLLSALGNHPVEAGAAQMDRLKMLSRIGDEQLWRHLAAHSVDFLHFGYRWQICGLLRELPTVQVIRLWDCFFANSAHIDIASLHSTACAAFLLTWRFELLRCHSFESLLLFLHKPPSIVEWQRNDVLALIDRMHYLLAAERQLVGAATLLVATALLESLQLIAETPK
jgi:TBC1 domain family member 2